jgi:DNA replication protein DnaC
MSDLTLLEKALIKRAKALGLYGLVEHWDDVRKADWLVKLLSWEEEVRAARSLDRRLSRAGIGRIKPIADFDWNWPDEIDRGQIDELFGLAWTSKAMNIVLVGPNGVGKSMIAKNLVQQAVLAGATALCLTASDLLNSLAEVDSTSGLRRRLALLARPQVLLIDEIGYLSYDGRHADLLYEVISRRYEIKPTIITTNKSFQEWSEVFPGAACVRTIVDRFIHRCEVVPIAGESYRLKESKEATEARAAARIKKQARAPRPDSDGEST